MFFCSLVFLNPVPGWQMPWAANTFKGEDLTATPTEAFCGLKNSENRGSYTKSVSSRSCDRGWNTRALRRIPNRQAVSSELANTRPTNKHQSSDLKPSEPRLGSDRQICHETWCVSCLTSFVTVLKSLCDPLNGFSCNLSAEVSIKRWRSATLWDGKKRSC